MEDKIQIAIKHLREGNIHQPHLDMAIAALEKQIPKRPVIKNWSPALCPSCGVELSESCGDGYYKHYSSLKICECGQKLKWDD